jgi:hypothetical protein
LRNCILIYPKQIPTFHSEHLLQYFMQDGRIACWSGYPEGQAPETGNPDISLMGETSLKEG